MGKHYHKLLTFLLVIALFITARMSIFTNDAVYAKQSATPQTMSRLLQPLLRSNNAGSFNVTGGVSGVDWKYIGNALTIIKSGTYTITGDGQQTSENIVVDNNFKGTIEINNINIKSYPPYVAPFNIANATVNLLVRGKNTLAAIFGSTPSTEAAKPGLMVGSSGNLTIQGDGKLFATGAWGAGIGSDDDGSGFGSITINSGVIQATSVGGAGIGSGADSTACGDITMNGGEITTAITGTYSGAGIGSGSLSTSACNITINGGTIKTAITGAAGNAAAIGSGYGNGNVGRITINGGDITAYTSGGNGAGIGSGYTDIENDQHDGNNIAINGGNIYAYSNSGAAIGSGKSGSAKLSAKFDIAITGGTVTAETNSNNPTMDIGYGENGVPGSLVIKNGSVKAVTNRILPPTDGAGHSVYVAKVGTYTGADVLDVDGQSYTRSGNNTPDDSTFYLYLTPQDHTITNHDWKAMATWNANDNKFIVEPMHSDSVSTNVMYDNTTSVPEPDNPTNPDWAVQVPSRITFTDDVRKYGVDVRMETVNGGSMPAYAVDVFVQSKKGYKLVLGSDKLDYDLQYRQKDDDPWQSMKKNGTQSGKIGTFAAGSSSGATIHGEAILSGIATKSGKYTDTLTYTLQKGQ